jgi:putative ABC transport system permease protein
LEKKNLIEPPRLSRKLLAWFLRPDLAEEVQGDLDERFYAVLKEKSPWRAKLGDWYQVLHYLRPFAIRRSSSHYLYHMVMLQSYFKIGWRNMSRQKMYAGIKIGGFALGVAACLLISLFIRHELSYDRHVPNKERLFRLVEVYNKDGEILKGVHLPPPCGPELKRDFPDIEEIARINPVELFGAGSNNIRRDDQVENTFEAGFVYADPSLMTLFNPTFVYGSAKTALVKPKSLVITKRKADRYFPNENPIGKLMVVNNDKANPLTIGGVIENMPDNTHLQYDFFITLSGLEFYPGEQTIWLNSNYPTYILVREGVSREAFEQKLQVIGEKYYAKPFTEAGFPNIQEELKRLSFKLEPVQDIHLNPMAIQSDGLRHGDMRFIMLSGAVAIFILLIACVNFINLSTAKSANRAKEVGLRKVVGSYRSNIINQFLSESVLYSLFSFVLGLLLASVLFPFFNTLVGKSMVFPWQEWWLVPAVLAGALIVGIVAGIYPSFYLSSFTPAQVLKGNLALGSKRSYTRNMLVVFQFTTSIILIIGTMVIHRQMQHILTAKIGFEKDQVLLIRGTDLLGDKVKTFKEELLRQKDVKYVSVSDYIPVSGTKRNGNGFVNEGKSKTDRSIGGQFWQVDHDYVQTFGLKLIEGRNFSKDMPSDSDAVVINQKMVKELGMTNPIGKRIENYKPWTVIGVVEDFHFESVRDKVEPLCMKLGNSPSIVSVKLNTADIAGSLDGIDKVWKRFADAQPIRYTFLDDNFAHMYEDVQRMEMIFTSFALLAIIVACLGLFGLSSFMVEQRRKEISIRLVLGASVNNVFRLLTQSFVRLVCISFVIAAPIAWYVMKLWLEGFEYRTSIAADVFIYAGGLALLIAMVTISYQAVHASLMRPVENLKSE